MPCSSSSNVCSGTGDPPRPTAGSSAQRSAALEDQIFRSLGLLANARLMSAEEAMTCISHLRLGVVLGLLGNVDLAAINRMFLGVQPGHLQLHAGREMDQEARKHARAAYLRAAVAGIGART